MADITVTEANVQGGTGTRILTGTTFEAIPTGSLVAVNRQNSNKLYLASAYEATDTFRESVAGVTVGKAVAASQRVPYQSDLSSVVTFGAGVLEQGMIYCASVNRGKICPITDLAKFLVTNVVLSSNVATITTAIPYAFIVGQSITIAGLTTTALNGNWVVASVPTSTTFTFAFTHGNISTTPDSGTVYAPGLFVNPVGIAVDTSNLKLLITNTGIAR